jgi:transposase
MPKPDDLSRSLTAFEQDSTLIAIIEMSLRSWLVAGILPGIERHPLKKLELSRKAASSFSRCRAAAESDRMGAGRWVGERRGGRAQAGRRAQDGEVR